MSYQDLDLEEKMKLCALFQALAEESGLIIIRGGPGVLDLDGPRMPIKAIGMTSDETIRIVVEDATLQ